MSARFAIALLASPRFWCLVDLADDASRSKQDPSDAPKVLLGLLEGLPEFLAKNVGNRLNHVNSDEFMAMSYLDFVVYCWNKWGKSGLICEVFKPMLIGDDKLMALLDKFVRTGRIEAGNKVSETMKPLAAAMDVQAMAPRITEAVGTLRPWYIQLGCWAHSASLLGCLLAMTAYHRMGRFLTGDTRR